LTASWKLPPSSFDQNRLMIISDDNSCGDEDHQAIMTLCYGVTIVIQLRPEFNTFYICYVSSWSGNLSSQCWSDFMAACDLSWPTVLSSIQQQMATWRLWLEQSSQIRVELNLSPSPTPRTSPPSRLLRTLWEASYMNWSLLRLPTTELWGREALGFKVILVTIAMVGLASSYKYNLHSCRH
jgi:hypothetical protein